MAVEIADVLATSAHASQQKCGRRRGAACCALTRGGHMSTGPRRALPDRRVHELFEIQARERPDAIAAVYGDRQLTYGELNSRANQLARALVARGVTSEAVVGVMTDRNLEWLTAVLAIFKAGGAYLPIEPHFPTERIARMVSRAGAELVLIPPLIAAA